ncbi:class I SAM-dependent methyltransferase [Immundisolibacter sp.]|uniref:class I SAM-dependent methyltransferase n=1 Tax=Immundisolibacter sp. TaxID=1934948 RepID=UPI00260B1488|nr:class I SAM-dependent methyltransferase [Immundisolibacter sp.]MDD3651758.1 class I SAM-dependent methyltransferase [Immundisolibacter sp.]
MADAPPEQPLAVLAAAGDARPAALAARLCLPLVEGEAAATLLLAYDPHGLELRAPGRRLTPLRVDFSHIGQHGGGELLRAARVKARPARLLDLTAGLATDAFRLARAGFEVLACERVPVIHALVEDALARAPGVPPPGKLELRLADARSVLADPALPAPDVVYLDPMFPGEGRTALPRRELQLLRELAGEDDTGMELLALARARARRRVVVKRPLHAPALAPDVSLALKGRAVRFDVYLTGG